MNEFSGQRMLDIEFLRLDVAGCGRCDGSQDNLRAAIALLAPVFGATGVAVLVREVPVRSAVQAGEVRLVSSPTVRVNGLDIGGPLTESMCGDCTAAGVAGAQVGCRVWNYQGRQHTDAPVGLIIDGILGQLYSQPVPADPAAYPGLPGNLQAFFATADDKSCC